MVIRRRHIAVLLVLLPVMAVSLYAFFFRQLIGEVYAGTAPDWFTTLVDRLYPRFPVEKQRFELAFFQHKADQVILRMSGLLLIIGVWLWFSPPARFVAKYSRPYAYKHFKRLRIVFYLGLLYYTWDWYRDFPRIVKMEEFYKGVHLFRLIGLEIPPTEVFYALFAIYLLSLLMVLMNVQKVFFAGLTALGLLLFQGYLFSFEKIEHGYSTLTYACLLMPFLFYELRQQKTGTHPKSFVLFLIQFCIAGAYFLAGAEKLLTGGLSWASPETFRTYLLLHPRDAGLWVADQPLLLHVMPWGVLILQLSFILLPFYPRCRLVLLPAGIAFHWGTTWLMGIGAYVSPWIFVYLFFLDLNSFTMKPLFNTSKSISQKGA